MNAISKEIGRSRPVEVQLQVSRYEQVASMLVSLLILVGVSVMLLFIVWLTNTLALRRPESNITKAGWLHDSNDAVGFEQAMAIPGLDELPELSDPQMAAALEALTDAVSNLQSTPMIVSISPTRQTRSKGVRDGTSTGTGTGTRDSDDPPEIPSDNEIPRAERWQIRWTSSGLDSYIRQLNFFKIELGAAGGKPKLDYVFNLSKERPDTREGAGADEKRLYMTWQGGKLVEYDKAILARGGIPTDNRLVLQFYPLETEERLATIELQNAESQGHSDVKEIRKTYFGVRAKGAGYEFFVEDQQFRVAPR